MYWHTQEDGSNNTATWHAACKVTSGVKATLQIFKECASCITAGRASAVSLQVMDNRRRQSGAGGDGGGHGEL